MAKKQIVIPSFVGIINLQTISDTELQSEINRLESERKIVAVHGNPMKWEIELAHAQNECIQRMKRHEKHVAYVAINPVKENVIDSAFDEEEDFSFDMINDEYDFH